MLLNTLIFDLDDTLVVEKPLAEESFLAVAFLVKDKYGIEPEDFIYKIRQQARALWYQLPTHPYCKKIGISSWEALWANFIGEHEQLKLLSSLKSDYQLNAWHQTLLSYKIDNKDFAWVLSKTFQEERRKRHVLFPDTLPVLNKLNGTYKLYLMTNGTPDLQWEKINKSGIKDYFESIFISGEIDYGKPDNRIFNYAHKKIGDKKENMVMIGNSLDSDIKGAKDFGIYTIWLNRTGDINNTDIIPDYEIENLYQIFDII